ncbi:MAG: hypothetical protein AB7F41_14605 [Methylocystis sp.]|uniref:hypothetical protein n=1 Tax=Methylocystis sp. TaxID=1911079 RepID=UPI003D0FA6B1
MCPEDEHAPHSIEGAAALRASLAPGAVKRAGFTGQIVGLDYALAALTAPDDCDRAAFMELLLIAEQGMLAGVAKLRTD